MVYEVSVIENTECFEVYNDEIFDRGRNMSKKVGKCSRKIYR